MASLEAQKNLTLYGNNNHDINTYQKFMNSTPIIGHYKIGGHYVPLDKNRPKIDTTKKCNY